MGPRDVNRSLRVLLHCASSVAIKGELMELCFSLGLGGLEAAKTEPISGSLAHHQLLVPVRRVEAEFLPFHETGRGLSEKEYIMSTYIQFIQKLFFRSLFLYHCSAYTIHVSNALMLLLLYPGIGSSLIYLSINEVSL